MWGHFFKNLLFNVNFIFSKFRDFILETWEFIYFYFSYHFPENANNNNNAKNDKWKYEIFHFQTISPQLVFTDRTPLRAQKRIKTRLKLPRLIFIVYWQLKDILLHLEIVIQIFLVESNHRCLSKTPLVLNTLQFLFPDGA